MLKKDLLKIYALTKTLWKSFSLPVNELEAKLHDDVWFDYLKDFDFNMVTSAFKQYAKKSEFCNIGMIAALCEKAITLPKLTEQDVLIEINKCFNAGGNCLERFKKLSSIAKKVVGSPSQLKSWEMCEISSFETVIASNILKAAKQFIAQENEQKFLEPIKKQLLENVKINEMIGDSNGL